MNLRHCEIQKFEFSNFENKNPKIICLFHKWFDGLNDTFEIPIQYAIVEYQCGKIEKISIEQYEIRFLSNEEVQNLQSAKTTKSIEEIYK